MSAFRRLIGTLRSFFFRARVERELESELTFHLDTETEKNIQLGMTRDAARRKALIAFGSVDVTKEAHRDGRGSRWFEDFTGDVRLALRSIRRNPGFAAAAIITLTLGIGANVAIFSAVHAVLLRPLPFNNPDRLVMLWEENAPRGWVHQTAAPANMLDWHEKVRAFAGVGGYESFSETATLTDAGEPAVFPTLGVTGDFFRVLGVKPAIGQLFRDNETFRTGERNVILSHRLWRDRFNSDTSIVGKTIKLNGRDNRVTGVLPESFAYPGISADIFRPTGWDPEQRAQPSFRRAHWMYPVARLRDGVTSAQANVELQTVVQQLQRDYPGTNTQMGAGLTPLHEYLIGESQRPLLILLGAGALLLLIACANVGNLLLVQATSRAPETALRLALGARSSRLVRQALTESFVLATLGALFGCMFGLFATRILGVMQPLELLSSRDAGVSWPMLAYVAAITITSSLLFGTAPILWSRNRAPGEAMREGGRSGTRRTRRWGEFLLVGEVALALVLTLGAGLLARSFKNLTNTDAGVNTDGVLTANVSLPGIRYDTVSKMTAFWQQLDESARAIPGVASVGAVSGLPLTAPGWSGDIKARGWSGDRFATEVIHRDVLPGYFETMRVPLLNGRYINATDNDNGERVVVINDEMARKFFPNEHPVGQSITFDRVADSTSNWYRIVGIVGSERQSSLAQPARPEIFQPSAQRGASSLTFVLRTNGNPNILIPLFRQALSLLDPNLALANVKTMTEVRAAASARERFVTVLLSVFAVVGFALAMVGVYGVMSRVARGRVREMGIRIALGAKASDVRWLVVRRGLLLTLMGTATGLVVSFLSVSVLSTLLYGVNALDPLTFGTVPVLLALAALIACWLPATRAGRADPMQALRAD